jgi:hypothetical protein
VATFPDEIQRLNVSRDTPSSRAAAATDGAPANTSLTLPNCRNFHEDFMSNPFKP